MIQSITIRNRVPFADEVAIGHCGKVNYIFGANGTGKTTIGRFLENPDDPSFSESQVVWDSEQADIYVYNKDFRDRHIRQEMPGIFTFGVGNVEAFQLIAEKKADLVEKREGLQRAIELRDGKLCELGDENNSFKERAWRRIYTPDKEAFSEALVGFKNKERFMQLLETTEHQGFSCTREELLRRAGLLFGQRPEEIPGIDESAHKVKSTIGDIALISKSELWEIPIVGNAELPIAQLIEKLDNSAWVSKGREYVEDDVCPFFQERTLTPALKMQIEKGSRRLDASMTRVARRG